MTLQTFPSTPVLVVLIDDPPQNPNVLEGARLEGLRRAIADVGFVQPVLLRPMSTGRFEVVDGVHRMMVAREEGLVDVPAIVVPMSDERAKAVQIAMNRLRGDLDLTQASHILAELVADGAFTVEELQMTGFTEEELGDMLKAVQEPEAADIMQGPLGAPPADGPATPGADKPWVLELTFRSKKDLDRVKRSLRKAGGKGNRDLAKGLLALVETSLCTTETCSS